ncbi:hypothetical protein F5146DRAFT_997753 [Armillaria mellea]|nr:hypothetical protein F5146DRAFT_997753 [Armillaria mellea]
MYCKYQGLLILIRRLPSDLPLDSSSSCILKEYGSNPLSTLLTYAASYGRSVTLTTMRGRPLFPFGLFLAIGDEDVHRDHGRYDRYIPPCNAPYRTIYVFPFIKFTGEADVTSPPSPIPLFQDVLRREILALARNKSAITMLFQSPWNQITGVSNHSTNPGGVTVFRCAKRATVGVVVAWRPPKKLGIAFCCHESLMTLDDVDPSKAPLSTVHKDRHLRYYLDLQGGRLLWRRSYRSMYFKRESSGEILKFYPETRISAFGSDTSEPLKDYPPPEVVHMSLPLQLDEGDPSRG